jgi:membrane protein implicated in regulation of membrane protease activity
MFTLYLFALLVGGALLLFSLFGGDAHDDVAHDVSHDLHGHNPVQWLSLRTAMYFLFVFGGVGAVLAKSWPVAAAPIVFAIALVAGVGVGAAVSAAFAFLRRTSSGDRDSDDSFVGLNGRMTLPFGHSSSGKVLVGRGDRTFELLARPIEQAAGDPATWQSVVVVEMRSGTAIVAPSDDPRARELSLNP